MSKEYTTRYETQYRPRSRTDILDEPQLATLKLFCRLTQCSLKWLYGQP